MKAYEFIGIVCAMLWSWSALALVFGLIGYGDWKQIASASVLFAVISFIKIDKEGAE